MDRRTRAAHLPVDTLSTRALSLCRLPFFFSLWRLPDLSVQRAISTSTAWDCWHGFAHSTRNRLQKDLGFGHIQVFIWFFLVLVF